MLEVRCSFDKWYCGVKTALFDKDTIISYYVNTPIQYSVIVHGRKDDYFQMKKYEIFLTFAKNIDRGNMLEPPH